MKRARDTNMVIFPKYVNLIWSYVSKIDYSYEEINIECLDPQIIADNSFDGFYETHSDWFQNRRKEPKIGKNITNHNSVLLWHYQHSWSKYKYFCYSHKQSYLYTSSFCNRAFHIEAVAFWVISFRFEFSIIKAGKIQIMILIKVCVLLILFCSSHQAYAQFNLNYASERTTMVHFFEWKWDNISAGVWEFPWFQGLASYLCLRTPVKGLQQPTVTTCLTLASRLIIPAVMFRYVGIVGVKFTTWLLSETSRQTQIYRTGGTMAAIKSPSVGFSYSCGVQLAIEVMVLHGVIMVLLHHLNKISSNISKWSFKFSVHSWINAVKIVLSLVKI